MERSDVTSLEEEGRGGGERGKELDQRSKRIWFEFKTVNSISVVRDSRLDAGLQVTPEMSVTKHDICAQPRGRVGREGSGERSRGRDSQGDLMFPYGVCSVVDRLGSGSGEIFDDFGAA